MLKQTIKKWQAGIDAYKGGNFGEAASCFKSIDDTSKILYCLGVVHFKQANYTEAINTFGKSVRCDPFLAVAYFMQGAACHMKNDIGGAATHYDEAIQALRGHEYIDYKQLGMDYKLLLCEILFNKALCLKGSGLQAVATMMKQATSCRVVRDERTRIRFEDLCNSVAAGTTNNPEVYYVPLDLMFLPPKIKDKPAKRDELPPQTSSTGTTPPTRLAPNLPSTPPNPTPAIRRPTATSAAPALPAVPVSQSRTAGSGKKLPPRPISLKLDAKIITIKCFYKDRRLIQISASSPDFDELQGKIMLKFEVEGLEIRYNSGGQMTPIRNLRDLQAAIDENFTELYLGFSGETNDFESQSQPASHGISSPPPAQISSPPALPPKVNGSAKPALSQPTAMSRAASTATIAGKTSYSTNSLRGNNLTQPTTLTKAASQPIKPLVASPSPSPSPYVPSPSSSPSISSFAANKSAVAAAVSASAAAKVKKPKSVWQECYTDEGERYFFNTETQETSWDPDIEPTPPWMVCYSDSGDKYYYNTDTDASTWDFPG